ncbi:MAG TPA: polysaccharide deacetylase family protein, partial [Sumerlaeia bacterium]|nr:polysaccharide deacetylase family protein [Sumerlaeia bacterium]
AYGYTSVTFDDLLAYRAGLAAPPPKPVMITGDDGYEGWLTYAYPILADPQINFRMTGFLETGAIRLGAAQGAVSRRRIVPAYEAIERYLSWDQAAFLESTGVFDMHPHTVSHPHLPQLSDEDAREELARSKADVESRLGKKARFLCYPYGEYSLRDQWLAREAGYFAAVTDRGGVETDCADKWDWDRIGIYAGVTVRYDPDRPWNFFPNLIEDPDIKIPKIRLESLEFLNPATGLPFAAGRIPRTASVTIRLTAANTGPAADVIAGLRLGLETNPSSSLIYDTHLTEPSQDIARNFPGTQQTFIWTWRVAADAPLGPYRAEATFHDVHYVLVFRTFSRQSALSIAPKDPPSAWILR